METSSFDPVLAFIGKVILAGGGLGAIALGLLKYFGSKWLDQQFAKRLQDLKNTQDRALRHLQSTIDREIHRAKKLYDSEFTALQESWRLLGKAYSNASSSGASFTSDVAAMTDEELDRHLGNAEVPEWKQRHIKSLTGDARQNEYYKWSEWQRRIAMDADYWVLREYLDSNSIFLPHGFVEKFRKLEAMI